MIALQDYYPNIKGRTLGQIRKDVSAMIEGFSWDSEVESQVGYFYDWDHDIEQSVLDDIKPWENARKVPMDIKYIVSSTQTMAKDAITYHIQLKPHQKVCVDYYDAAFAKRYSAHYPCGLYVDLADAEGKWNRWLVVAMADYNDPQFPTFEILRCDYVLNAIIKGVRYNIPVALRSQSSYNSGVWRDYRTETIEDQQKFIAPMNRLTENIWYNKRFLIDNMVDQDECRAWRTTKVNRVSFNGLVMVTLAQDHFNKDTDLIERDRDGNTIALWADVYSEPVLPEDYDPLPAKPSGDYGVIAYSGKNEVKVGGSYKKLEINFFDRDGNPVGYKAGTWSFTIGNEAVEPIISTVGLSENQIKIKLPNEGLYINKILAITFTVAEDMSKVKHEMSVVSL